MWRGTDFSSDRPCRHPAFFLGHFLGYFLSHDHANQELSLYTLIYTINRCYHSTYTKYCGAAVIPYSAKVLGSSNFCRAPNR